MTLNLGSKVNLDSYFDHLRDDIADIAEEFMSRRLTAELMSVFEYAALGEGATFEPYLWKRLGEELYDET
jgi:hypothetical protein